MPSRPPRSDDAARLEAFEALEILDTPNEPIFDHLVELLRQVADAESAGLALIDGDRQWFKSIAGRDFRELPLSEGFASSAVAADGVLWIEDARLDPRFTDRKLVRSGVVVSYAGVKLITPSGCAIGALSFVDRRPRPYSVELAARLEQIAVLVMDALQQRLARRGAELVVAHRMLRKAPSWIVVMDRDLRLTIVSEKAEALSGRRESELIGQKLLELYPGMQGMEPAFRRGLEGESISRQQQPYQRRDGSWASINWEVVPWVEMDGRVTGVTFMTVDVTELVRSREAASRSEERLTLALDAAETLVWELDFATGRVQSVGDAPRFLEERIERAECAEDLLKLVHPDDRARVTEEWAASIGAGKTFRSEYRMVRGAGEELWVASTAFEYRDAGGQRQRLIGALRDVSARKQKDFALELAREEAEAANRAKSEFLANMSHEIRTPLNGVLGIAGALARTSLTEHQQSMVKLIESSAQTLEGLLGDILDLARIESGRLELRAEAFDLSQTIGSIAALFARSAQEKGIGFQLDQRTALDGAYVGDPVRLKQVFCNLLSNAVKFTHVGGVILRVDQLPGDQVYGDRDDCCLRFQVIDTGVGFEQANAGRLFQRFEQADGSITRQYGGTGLGLAISQSIAEAMGGRLDAVSCPGQGSTFTFTLPLQRVERTVVCAAPAPEPLVESARPLRVLLAEDHPINREVVRLILHAAAVELTSVVDGAEAVEAFSRQGPFDLVFMDMQMPVMDGLTATRTIRAEERRLGLAPTPIYALTANAMPEHVALTLEAGADGHLSKPLAAVTLLAVVEQVAGEREGAAPHHGAPSALTG